jgi:HlyD family secretion protein
MVRDLSRLRIDRSKNSPDSSGKRLWMLISALLAAAVLILGWYSFSGSVELEADPTPPEPVTAVPPAEPESEISREVLIASGYIVAHHKHELGSKVMGRVEWIGVEKGDFVRKGQLLVKLEDREYRAQLEESQAALELAKRQLEELEAGSRPEEIARAEAVLARSLADLENARLEMERHEELLAEEVVSQQELDNSLARYRMAEAAVEVARRELELLRIGPRKEKIHQARAEVARAKAALSYSQTMLDATEIRAPITGTVLRRIAEIGEMITTSFAGTTGAKSAVVALADLNDLQVELDISQKDFKRISAEHECQMIPEAYPDRQYECEIDEIAPEADRQKASIQVKVKILEPDEYLRPEMSARVIFSKKDERDDE